MLNEGTRAYVVFSEYVCHFNLNNLKKIDSYFSLSIWKIHQHGVLSSLRGPSVSNATRK
jgi:hypothetical protein